MSIGVPYYNHGGISIYHGDCLGVLPRIIAADHVITDPPYEAQAHTRRRRQCGRRGVIKYNPLDFDAMDEETRTAVGAEVARICGRWCLVFCQVEAAMLWRDALAPMSYRRTCVWVKPDGTPQFTGDQPGMGYESIVCTHAPGRSKWSGGGRRGVFTHSKQCGVGRNVHQTEKPLALMLELVGLFTDPGELIIDPFMGSGTTLRAAKDLGRRAIGIEKDERHCKEAVRRLSQETLFGGALSAPAGHLGG